MKIRVFPNRGNSYSSIVIETDELPVVHSIFYSEDLPSVFVDDIIDDLISEN